tara:strand:- start:2777 stop:3253 length:477 start_codon:yes stop_codon:yes gene_type:complete
MTETKQELDRALAQPAVASTEMSFRLKNRGWRTYAGPEYLNCVGSMRPIIHCFTVRRRTLGKKGDQDARVWFVAVTIPQLIDDETRIAFIRKIYAAKNRLIRSFNYRGEKLKVFYTRASAVRAFSKLVDARNQENAAAKRELSEAVARGDYATASDYI